MGWPVLSPSWSSMKLVLCGLMRCRMWFGPTFVWNYTMNQQNDAQSVLLKVCQLLTITNPTSFHSRHLELTKHCSTLHSSSSNSFAVNQHARTKQCPKIHYSCAAHTYFQDRKSVRTISNPHLLQR